MRAAMVAYSFYEGDNRIMRYAEALSGRGDQVDVLALRRKGSIPVETINGVTLFRIQKREINERGKLTYLCRLLAFLVRSSVILTLKHLRKPYDLIHVHSVPDFEVFAAFIPKLLGAKVILDVHDIVPEFYASKFNVSKKSLTFRALQFLEKLSAAFSDHVIIANHLWEKVITARSVSSDKCSTYLNYPDSSMFSNTLRTREEDGRCVMIYPGSLNKHQGLDLAVRAFARIEDQAPEARFDIYGEGAGREEIAGIIMQLGLQERVRILPVLPIKQIAKVMANADIGVVPKLDGPFGGDAFSTKIFEFMALGVPIIAANTRIDRYYFNDTLVKFFQAGDEESLAAAMLLMIRDPSLRKKLAANASRYVVHQSWDLKREDYFKLVDRLVNEKT
jgi:glycosyltransferase involved in cell wall biosynthesis